MNLIKLRLMPDYQKDRGGFMFRVKQPKGKNTHTAERPAACDLIRRNKSTALFPRIESQAAGRSAPPRSAPLYVFFCPYAHDIASNARTLESSRQEIHQRKKLDVTF
jgi:hypothetical protein